MLNVFKSCKKDRMFEKKLALDCGAGIGRITKNLLLKNFANVDMVDVSEHFIRESFKFLGEQDSERVQRFYICGLQNFIPEKSRYDCKWIQWVVGYLRFKFVQLI